MEFNWVPVSPLPHLIPWLAVLVLLALRQNRTPAAWWVLLPLVWGLVFQHFMRSSAVPLPAQVRELLASTAYSLCFGLAFAWLLSNGISWNRRLTVFLGLFGLTAAGSALSFVLTQDWDGADGEASATAIAISMGIFVVSAALVFAGYACRKHHTFLRLLMWTVVLVPLAAALIVLPFFIYAWVASRGSVDLEGFGLGIMMFVGVGFGVLLPFVLLSGVNGFYRERLAQLLRFGRLQAQPLAAAPRESVEVR